MYFGTDHVVFLLHTPLVCVIGTYKTNNRLPAASLALIQQEGESASSSACRRKWLSERYKSILHLLTFSWVGVGSHSSPRPVDWVIFPKLFLSMQEIKWRVWARSGLRNCMCALQFKLVTLGLLMKQFEIFESSTSHYHSGGLYKLEVSSLDHFQLNHL